MQVPHLRAALVGPMAEVLTRLGEQALLPLYAGWAVRRKSSHFRARDEVVVTFAAEVDFDPWLINPYFGVCESINPSERTGEACLTADAGSTIPRMRAGYAGYGVTEAPFAIVAADAGTHGMGIMRLKSADEVVGLDRRQSYEREHAAPEGTA